jgi:hypothetical protein
MDYLRYGDRRLLVDNYPTMTAYLRYLQTQAGKDGLLVHQGKPNSPHGILGDWASAIPNTDGADQYDWKKISAGEYVFPVQERELFTNCYYIWALDLAADIAEKIQADMDYPGQIKVTVIRETRAVEYAR